MLCITLLSDRAVVVLQRLSEAECSGTARAVALLNLAGARAPATALESEP